MAAVAGPHEQRARSLMSKAALCNIFTADAVIEQGRVADEQQGLIDALAREVMWLRDRLEGPRPPVAREQMELAE